MTTWSSRSISASSSHASRRSSGAGRPSDRRRSSSATCAPTRLTRMVTWAGETVELTPREYALLEFMVRRPGQIVSRSQLLEQVWAEDYEGSPNVVDVYIGYVRRKLERDGVRPLIRTVRGSGFVLEPGGARTRAVRLPIRARLTAWYALLAALALAVVGVFLVLKLRSDLRSTIDREVRSAVSVIEQSYLAEGRPGVHRGERGVAAPHRRRRPGARPQRSRARALRRRPRSGPAALPPSSSAPSSPGERGSRTSISATAISRSGWRRRRSIAPAPAR